MADHGVISSPGTSVDTTSQQLKLDPRKHVKLGPEKVYDVGIVLLLLSRCDEAEGRSMMSTGRRDRLSGTLASRGARLGPRNVQQG